MRYAVVALAVLAAACGGDAKPRATPSPTQSTAALTPEAKAVRDAVAATLAACPCRVSVDVGSYTGPKAYFAKLRGVYDPKANVAELKERADGAETGIVFRIVDGRTYMDPALGKWVELDFAGVPAEPVSVLYPIAFADPRIAFGLMGNVTVAAPTTPGNYDVQTDMAVGAPATGPWAALATRLFPGPSAYGDVTVENGRVTFVQMITSDAAGVNATIALQLKVEATGLPAPAAPVPTVERMVDVANEKIDT